MKVFGIVLTILAVAECLFEDQVGKFDWRSRHIGCPKQVELSRSAAGKDFLLATTEKNALASLNVNSGDIDWRQVQEIDGRVAPKFAIPNSSGKNAPFVALLTNNGEYLRVFKRGNGVLLWQQRILQQAKKFNNLFVTNDLVFVISESSVMGFKATSGEKTVERILDNVSFAETIVNSDEKVLIVTVTGKIVKIFEIDGEPLNSVASLTLTGEVKKCIVSGSVLACLDATGSVSTVELTEKDPKVTNILSSADADLKKLSIPGYFVIRSVANIVVYNSEQGKLKELLKLPSTKIFTGKLDVESKMPLFAAYYDYERRFKLFDLTNGKEKFTTIIEPVQQASVKTIDILASGKSLQLLTVRKDCRMDLYEMIIGETTKANLEWTRFEALADISSVDMLDLPLSESQAMIETEFSGHETNMVKMLYRRITAQIEEFKRGLLTFFDRIIKSFDLWINKQVSFSIVMKNLFGDDSAIRRTKKPRPGSIVKDEDLILERDYFNLRKIIVATSYSGSIYGILSEDGSILWSLYLGDDFTVLKNQFNQKKIPLFIQRGTAHYQYKSQAIVAFGLKHSQSTRMVVFNPINGELMDTIERPKLKRIDLLPFPNDDMILPVLTVDLNDKIDFYPSFGNNYPTDRLISLFNVDGKTGEISGSKVDLKDKKMVPSWKSSLSFGKQEKVVNIVGKPNNQKVHSSGRVLGDRSVLYKYSNPNLVAVQTYDYDSSTMAIYMIDTIIGQIVHTARHTKVKSPFHLVHCENWVVYTYWNEKSRRTELGVIELFEGLEQTNADHFNSLTTTKKPVEVVSKSFVFSQGVSAMVASETEMGLTFRSLLIAMPFGGILELPRRIADARRPLEMTPELREEMIFPYMPEIPIATEELINYNQTVEYIHGIKTAASGLESTSLMLAYGMDMFFTRVTPSGTFDILKDDFDYALIGAVVAVLIISSFVVKRIWRQNSVKQAWA